MAGPIQKQEGTIDALTRGFLSGQKIAALQTEVQSRKVQNALLSEELSHASEKFELEKGLFESRTAAADAAAGLASARATFEGQQEGAKARATVRGSVSDILEQGRQPGISDDEAFEAVSELIPLMKEAGSPIVAGGPLHQAAAQQLRTMSDQLEQENEIEREKNESLSLFRQLSIQNRIETTATPGQAAQLKARLGEIDQKLSSLAFPEFQAGASADPQKAAEAKRQVDVIRADLERMIADLVSKDSGDTLNPRPQIGDVDASGHVFQGGDPNNADNWELP